MIEAVKDKIIVTVLKEENISDGGIILPETASSNAPQSLGEVVSIGPDASEETGIKKGDIIVFAKFAGQDIIINKYSFKVLMSGEVYGIFAKEVN